MKSLPLLAALLLAPLAALHAQSGATEVAALETSGVPHAAWTSPKPSVLLVGDAVAAQYAGNVRDLLKERVNVDYLAAPTGAQPKLTEFIAQVVAAAPKYQLIYFAFGLDYTREVDSVGKAAEPGKGKPPLNPQQFYKFLDDLYHDIYHTDKKIIWSTAVPVPEGLSGFPTGRLETYNHIASDMAYNRHTVLLDLYDYVRIRRADLQRPGDFMFTDTGASLVASVVVNKIEEVLLEGNEPSLPYVLALGDSIVGQYSTFLRGELFHKANVRTGGTAFDAHPDWPAIVRREVADREREMGHPFDVIQFNWGLHALKWAKGNEFSQRQIEGFSRCIPLERYGAELEKLVMELEKTDRKLVWATTTPNHEGSQPDDAEAYNAIALEVMRQHHIPVNDLYDFVTREHIPQDQPQGCHFPRASAERLGREVAATLLAAVAQARSNISPAKPDGESQTALVAYQKLIDVNAANPARYTEIYRPQYHFTPIQGWMNDPNGLCFFQGQYHLFYQHTFPGQPVSGANWGHAVSKDLVHWEQRVPAIPPDEKGNIWSGSAVVDWKDTSGFFGGQPGLVCIYTCMNPAEDKRQSIAIAYSADGVTFTKYEKNPVLPQLRYQPGQPDDKDFRDPKVFWHEPTQRWVMVAAGGKLRIYSSPNLRDWTFESINNGLNTECPDLFELPVEGDAKASRWVLSGAGEWYRLGNFDGHKFTPEGGQQRFNYGYDFYASQTWNEVPNGRRLMTTWLYNWGDEKWPFKPWGGGSMTLPYELKLRQTPVGLRVFSTPIKEMETLRGQPQSWGDQMIGPGTNLLEGISGKALEIEAEFDVSKATGSFGFKVPKGGSDQTIIGYRIAEGKMFVTRSGYPDNKKFDRTDIAPLPAVGGIVKLHLYLDTSSVEVFGNDGAAVITEGILPDPKREGLELFAEGGEVKLVSLKAWPLQSVWRPANAGSGSGLPPSKKP